MRNVIDSTTTGTILQLADRLQVDTRGLMAGVYANGKFAAPAAHVELLERRGMQVFHIDVKGDAPDQAAVLDWEKGDVQHAATLTRWVKYRSSKYRGDAVVYCNHSSLEQVLPAAAAAGVPCGIWLASLLGTPPLDPGVLQVKLPRNLYLLGCQYLWSPGGWNVDLSIFFADHWHPALHGATRSNADVINVAHRLLSPSQAHNVSRETSTIEQEEPVTENDGTTPTADPANPADPAAPADVDPAAADPTPDPPIVDPSMPSAGSSSGPVDPPAMSSGSPTSTAPTAPTDPSPTAPGTAPLPASADPGSTSPAPEPIPAPVAATGAPVAHGGTHREGLLERLSDGVEETAELLRERFPETATRLQEIISIAAEAVRVLQVL